MNFLEKDQSYSVYQKGLSWVPFLQATSTISILTYYSSKAESELSVKNRRYQYPIDKTWFSTNKLQNNKDKDQHLQIPKTQENNKLSEIPCIESRQ